MMKIVFDVGGVEVTMTAPDTEEAAMVLRGQRLPLAKMGKLVRIEGKYTELVTRASLAVDPPQDK